MLHHQKAAEPAALWRGAVSVAMSWCATLAVCPHRDDRRQRRLLKAKAQVLEQLGDVEHIVVDPEALVNELLDHGRTPAGTAEPHLDRPLLDPGSEGDLLRWGQFGWAACGLRAWRV